MRQRKKQLNGHPELGLPEVRKAWQTIGLFSDHYLKARISQNTWWPKDDEVRPLWEFCRDLYNKRYVACAKNNEAFTRQELLNNILDKLGFPYTVNLGLPESQQDLEPDYILYPDAETKELVIDKSAAVRYRAAVAILEAKKVNHPLSQRSKHQQRYPHQQIRDYLNEAQVLSWGILTNGNEWRLYCRDAKPSQFFSLNFEVAIQSPEKFKYFFVLFSPAAFARDAQGKCRLDLVRESAVAAQTELEEDLRQRVFALVEILANGFAERPENDIPDTPEGHRLLYENCLIFLYQLLFILYAEGRQLLPIEPKSRKYYKDLSLAHRVGDLKNFSYDSHTQTRLYREILDLCRLINGTNEKANCEYDVPRYNGGLFDPTHHPELEQWEVCDAVLAEVLRGLMFAKPAKQGSELPLETVDYADLRVQQLGSIYEGLLEHLLARSKDGRLELQTDKGERKATGTYYTPDYIVKYIVDQTLGPLVAEIEKRAEVKAARAAGRQDNSFAEEMLKLNVCDPAMGSGHFLVEATTYLADHIVYHPTTKFQAEFTKGESQEQAEIAYWRRRVVEACIYGVDLNPLAVELAKLSLWLTTIAGDQPLNFLDHHLRCGNSLIGARLDQLSHLPSRKGRARSPSEPSQIEFTFGPDFKRVVGETIRQIQGIEAKASRDVSTVKDKEKLWLETILPVLAPYKAVADLWMSTYFGQPLDNETYVAKAGKIVEAGRRDPGVSPLAGEFDPVGVGSGAPQRGARPEPGATPLEYSAKPDRRFFHWELEFPEVFFNEDGVSRANPGFDAVIGNPPYGQILDQVLKAFLISQLYQATEDNWDNYSAFCEKAFHLCRDGTRVSMIIPNTFTIGPWYSGFRRFFGTPKSVESLVNFGRLKVFPDPITFVAIPLFRKGRATENCQITQLSSIEQFVRKDFKMSLLPSSKLVTGLWVVQDELFEKLESRSIPLGELCDCLDSGMDYNKKSVGNKVFYEGSRQHDGDIRYLRGSNINRYYLEQSDLWLRHDWKSLVDKSKKENLKVNVSAYLDHPKIFTRQTADKIIAAIAYEGCYNQKSLHSTHLKPTTKGIYTIGFLTTVLNSTVSTWFYRKLSDQEVRKVYAQIKIDRLQRTPIPRIDFTTPPTERKRLVAKGRELYERCLAANDAVDALEFVEKQLREKRSDVIHDLLAFLAERMMELNKEKQTTVKQFLNDLKDFHSIDTCSLTPKTKLDEFWKLEAADVFTHLRANAKKLAAQGIRLKETDEEKIRDRFQKAKDQIVPLESALAFTDRLIDQIVYHLYGLTEEEIRVVDRSMAK